MHQYGSHRHRIGCPLYSEQRYIQFRAEFFNVLNRVNFGLPNAVVFTSAGRDGSAGRITTTSGTARQIQLGVKLSF